MIAIIDYKAGNLASVSNAFSRLETEHQITNNTKDLDQADGVIFPGVGHASAAMKSLRENNLVEWLRQTTKPVLGVCLGMQLLFESTDEGPCDTLGIVPGHLKKFDEQQGKVPHMGWNTVKNLKSHPLLTGISANNYFYYVHSYYAPVNKYTVGTCEYISEFTSVVVKDNYYGVQFHPEKSGDIGARLLQNFLDIVHQPIIKET